MGIVEKFGITSGPWKWANSPCGDGEVQLEGNIDDSEMNPVLLAHGCGQKDCPLLPNASDKGIIASAPEMLEALNESVIEEELNVDAVGGCDHSVGICMCDEINAFERRVKLIERITEMEWKEIKELLR